MEFNVRVINTIYQQAAGLNMTMRLLVVVMLQGAYGIIFLVLMAVGFDPPIAITLGIVILAVGCAFVGLRYSFIPIIITSLLTAILLRVSGAIPLDSSVMTDIQGMSGFIVIGLIAGTIGSLMKKIRLQRNDALQVLKEKEQLSYTLQNLKELIEDVSDMVYLINVEGYFTYVNPGGYKLTGYDTSRLVGMHFVKLVAPAWRERVIQYYVDQLQSGKKETLLEFPILTADKQEKWVEQRVVTVFKDNQVMGFRSIVRDVTERKEIERQLEINRDQALVASRFKSQIIANVSHEARTPLNIISVSTEMLHAGLYGDINAEQQEVCNSILTSVQDLVRFFNNLLDQSGLEQGKIHLHYSHFATQHLVDRIDRLLGPMVKYKNLEWHIHVGDKMPDTLYGDLEKLIQIAFNLVDNAIKFTEKGDIRLKVSQIDSAHWAMEVSDTGIGIPEDESDRIFDTFWQVDGSSNRSVQKGVGLGLSIVRKLAKLMGGHVFVHSQPNRGSVFTVMIPYKVLKTQDVVETNLIEG